MTSKELVYRLLARALLDIRIAAHEEEHRRAFHIADLFHNVPLRLIGKPHTEHFFADVLDDLRTRSEQKGIGAWLSNAVADCSA